MLHCVYASVVFQNSFESFEFLANVALIFGESFIGPLGVLSIQGVSASIPQQQNMLWMGCEVLADPSRVLHGCGVSILFKVLPAG